jgi:hypothetical protein
MDACSRFSANFDVADPDWPSKTEFGVVNMSVGWLMEANKDWVVLAGELSEDLRPRDIMNIPTAIVLEMAEILPKEVQDGTNS